MNDPTSASRDSFLPSGATTRVGQYELLTALGKGGMAYVYLARKMGSGGFERLVAVKVMHRNIAADEEFVQMFLDEARLAARIHHPNVVSILDLGNDSDQLYMVMDYIEGDTLAAIQRTAIGLQRTIPLGISLRIVLDALIGLDAAHNLRGPDGEWLQLIHRDVSPQNILVGSDGAARLVDFGIARAERRLSLTSVGMLKGKAPFMAPEQLEGGVVDRRADVFSMGVTLWETLALRRCFPARARPDLIHESLKAPYRSLLMFTDQIPEQLDGLCEKALAYDPADRYASAGEFADAIEANFRADIATQRQVGQFMSAVVSEKIGRERDAVRQASSRNSEVDLGRARTSTPDPNSVLGRVDSSVKPLLSAATTATGSTRHRKDSIGALELRAPTPPPSLELQAASGFNPLIAPNSRPSRPPNPMRAPTPAPKGRGAQGRSSDHELSDQPTMVKQVPHAGGPVRATAAATASTAEFADVPELPRSDSMLRLPDLPDLEAATSVAKHKAIQKPAVSATESRAESRAEPRSEAPRKGTRFSTMAGGGLPHTRAPTPASGNAAPQFAAPSRIAATEDSSVSRARPQPQTQAQQAQAQALAQAKAQQAEVQAQLQTRSTAEPMALEVERVTRARPQTLAGLRVPKEFQRSLEDPAPSSAMRAQTPAGTTRGAPIGLRAPTPPGMRSAVPQNFDQMEALLSTAPAELDDDHEAALDIPQSRDNKATLLRRGPEKEFDGLEIESRPVPSPPSESVRTEGSAMSALRAPTPAGGRPMQDGPISNLRAPTPAQGRANLPLTLPTVSAPPTEAAEEELEKHRVRPQVFVEPPQGLPLFARVAIALVLFALMSFAGWHLLNR